MMYQPTTGIAQSTNLEGQQALQEQYSSTELKDILAVYPCNENNADDNYSLQTFFSDSACGLPEDKGVSCTIPNLFDPVNCSLGEFYKEDEHVFFDYDEISIDDSVHSAENDCSLDEFYSDTTVEFELVKGFETPTPAFLKDSLSAEYSKPRDDYELPSGAPQVFSSIPASLLPQAVSERKLKDIDERDKRATQRDMAQIAKFMIEHAKFMACAGEVYLFEAPCWKNICQHQFTVYLRKMLRQYEFMESFSTKDYRHIFSLIQTEPSIQVDYIPDPPPHTLNLLDGTLDLRSMKLHPHQPADCFFDVLNLCYEDICDPCDGDTFERFAAHIGNGDPLVRQQLLELTALVLTGTQLKYFYLLLGESHTGKSQWGVFLQELVGRHNSATLAGLHDFESKFGTADMAGKKLVTALDLPNHPLPQVSIGVLKQCCGDDPLKTQRKYKDNKIIYRKPLIVLASNHPLQIPSVSKETALLNRLITIPFRNPVDVKDQRQQLYKDFLKEKDYIVLEAIKAYRNLLSNNFQVTKVELPEAYLPQEGRQKFSAVQHFLFTQCEQSRAYEVSTAALHQAYDAWSYQAGYPQLSLTEFGRLTSEILSTNDSVNEVKRAGEDARRGYRGIRIRQ